MRIKEENFFQVVALLSEKGEYFVSFNGVTIEEVNDRKDDKKKDTGALEAGN